MIRSLHDIAAGRQGATKFDDFDRLGHGAAALRGIGRIAVDGNGHFASHLTGGVPFESPAGSPRAEFLGWFRIGRDWRAHGDLLGWVDVGRPEVLYVLYTSYLKAMRAAGRVHLKPMRIGQTLHAEGLLLDRDVERYPSNGEIRESRFTKTIWLSGALPHTWCVRTEDVFGCPLPESVSEERVAASP